MPHSGSFWSNLGEKAKNGFVGAFDAARAGLDSPTGKAVLLAISPGMAFARTPQGQRVGNTALAPIIWTSEQASRSVASTFGLYDIVDARGGGAAERLSNTFSPAAWGRAWDMAGDTTGGSALAYLTKQYAQGNFTDQRFFNDAGGQTRDFAEFNKSTSGRIFGGAADIALTWYADPTIVGGKLVKLSRAANAVQDAAKADEVTKAFDAKGLALTPATATSLPRGPKAVFAGSNNADETANRFSALVASTDNMDVNRIAAHLKPVTERSPDAAPIIDLLGQASRIEDITLQRQVKANVLLAAMGSSVARARLIEDAPTLARAMQRVSLPPEEFAVLDRLSANADQLYGQGESLTAAARALATKGNKEKVEAYGQRLDQIHRHMRDIGTMADEGGALERAGLTGLDKAKSALRTQTAQEFYYQDGTSGITMRVLHWATNQRFRGVVPTDDAYRGQEALLDHLKRSGLYTGAERADISQKWFKANGQNLRNKLVDELWTDMFSKAALRNGFTEAEAKKITEDVGTVRKQGRKYTTTEMERARAEGKSRIVLEDPVSGTPTSIDMSLFESHIRNNVALPDTQLIERTLRHVKDAGTLGDKARKAEESLLAGVQGYNDVWRLAVLARPGLFFRTQLDTQLRVMATIGTTEVMKNTLVGLGHSFNKMLGRDELVRTTMQAEDRLNVQSLMGEAADLRRKAGLLSGDPGARLLANADQIEAQAKEVQGRLVNPQRLGATDKTIKVGSGAPKLTTRAYDGEDQRKALWDRLLPGDATISDALTQLGAKTLARFIENAADYTTHMPEDLTWSAGYARALDPILGSYAGRKILENLDMPVPQLVAKLRGDKQVRDAWLEVRFDNPRLDDWIDRSVSHVRYMAPTPTIRKAILSGKRIEPSDVDRLFKGRGQLSAAQIAERKAPLEAKLTEAKQALAEHTSIRTKADAEMRTRLETRVEDAQTSLDDFMAATPEASVSNLADRMPVQGPSFSPFGRMENGKWKNPILYTMNKIVSIVSDLPDMALARHPMYVSRYFKNFKDLAEREAARSGEVSQEAQALIHKTARHRAIKDVQQTLYDTARYTGSHAGLMRVVSPFLNAWEDAVVSWSRIMYDDPKKLGALVKTWNAPERMGLITDENGNVLRPGQSEVNGRPIRQKFFTVTMPGPLAKWAGVTDFKIRKDSFNSIFQGEVPWMPGFGPMVNIPAQQVVTRAFPEFADPNGPVPKVLQPFVRQALNGDAQKVSPGVKGGLGDAVSGSTPAWVRHLFNAFDNTSPAYTNVFQNSWNSQIIEAQKTGKAPDYAAIEKKALAAARNTTIIKGLALFTFGTSGEGGGVQDFYSNQYRAMTRNADQYRAEGKSVEEVFNEQFPEAANLRFSVSVNNTGIQAFLKTEQPAKKFAKEITANPEWGWAYVGAANVASGGADEFSGSIYNAQSSRQLRPGSKKTQRERLTPDEMVAENRRSQGWGQYQQVSTRIDLILEDRGLTSINDAGAEDLKQIKDQFVAGMRATNDPWKVDFDNFDQGKLKRFFEDFATPALADPRLKDRSDIKMLGKYLQVRDRAIQIAESRGYTLKSQQNAADLRAVLQQAGTQMARQNIGFEQLWNRVLSREVS